jgi:hypothetical protein
MAQFSVKIIRLTGSVLGANQQAAVGQYLRFFGINMVRPSRIIIGKPKSMSLPLDAVY